MPYKDLIKRKEYNKRYRLKNEEKIRKQRKEFRLENEEKIKEQKKKYYLKYKDKILERQKEYGLKNKDKKIEYRLKNREKYLKQKKDWYLRNKDRVRECVKQYSQKKYHSDIQYKLACRLRSRINQSLKDGSKSGSAIRDLGCTIPELKTYLESKFQPGMSWENHGFYGWHIDHAMPLDKFDLTDREQFLKACHYTNVQPLWWRENLVKNNKVVV
mgnify:CR=1 FL=1